MEEVRRGLVKYEDPTARDAVWQRSREPQPVDRAMKVALGVGGGIAAYKAAELARLCRSAAARSRW